MFKLLSLFTSPDVKLDAARAVLTHIAEVLDARISIRLWDGSVIPLGRDADPTKYLSISSPGVIGSLLRWPTLDNVIRHYAAGRIDFHGGDLMAFIDAARVGNSRKRLKEVRKGLLLKNALPFLFARADKTETEHGYVGDAVNRDQIRSQTSNRDYIKFHYDDVGNDFYELFLEPEMQYTCAYYTNWSNTLEQAQIDKLDMTCRKLRLQPGEKMLDIGCGWGGLICHAARYFGVRAHGISISKTQLDYAQAKINRLGLEKLVTVEMCDYANHVGTYDKISSVGMTEHVGIANYPKYFGKIFSLLRDRGILLNHCITRRAKASRRRFKKMRPEQKFIAKYIFPGGELDHVGHIVETLETRSFEVHDVEDWREHYMLTCRAWAERLYARRDEAIKLVGSERYRLWLAYLAGCSYTFEDGTSRIYQVVASKHANKGRAELPPTRADLYRRAG